MKLRWRCWLKKWLRSRITTISIKAFRQIKIISLNSCRERILRLRYGNQESIKASRRIINWSYRSKKWRYKCKWLKNKRSIWSQLSMKKIFYSLKSNNRSRSFSSAWQTNNIPKRIIHQHSSLVNFNKFIIPSLASKASCWIRKETETGKF